MVIIHTTLLLFCLFHTLGSARQSHGLRHKDPARKTTRTKSGFTTQRVAPMPSTNVDMYHSISTVISYPPFHDNVRKSETPRSHSKDFSPPLEPNERPAKSEESGGMCRILMVTLTAGILFAAMLL